MPIKDIEHQQVASNLASIAGVVIGWAGQGTFYQGVNVSDRADDWTKNYRCPDVAVSLEGNPAVAKDTHWLGGPDFAVEVISPDDRSREKLDFYAKVGVRELLLIDRDPWALELYLRKGGDWSLAGRSKADDPQVLISGTLGLQFRLAPGDPRPTIEVTTADGSKHWPV